jgi:hypothetical protein
VQDTTPGVSSFLWYLATQNQHLTGEAGFYRMDLNDVFTPITPVLVPTSGGGYFFTFQYGGASADLSHVIFGGAATLLPGDPVSASNWWETVNNGSGPPTTRLLAADANGTPISGACGASFGSLYVGLALGHAEHAISADGSIVYFDASPGCSGGTRVYKRTNGGDPIEVSASQCVRSGCDPADGNDSFIAASENGSRVFFNSTRQLTDSDTDSENDIYLYDPSPPSGQRSLVQVSAGEVTAGHPTVGSGADIISATLASDDGSHIYFVARGQLTADAVEGAPNLFVYERDAAHPAGRLALVATLSEADAHELTNEVPGVTGVQSAEVAPREGTDAAGHSVGGDGHILVFRSTAQLLPADTNNVDDVYRYDGDAATAAERLQLISPGDQEFAARSPETPTSSSLASAAQNGRGVSEDGSTILFSTTQPLVAADVNNREDIYEWHDGHIAMISDGRRSGDTDVAKASMSASGEDILFSTPVALVASDVDFVQDVYDARVNGGFPGLAAAVAPCTGDACQGPAALTPFFTVPGSTTPSPQDSAPAASTPVFSVAAVTAKQRSGLGQTGKITLTVKASDTGTLTAKATAVLGKRTETLAGATKSLVGGGSVGLTLSLSKAARAQLASTGKLTVKLTVSYSRAPTVFGASLKLTHAKSKSGKHKTTRKKKSSKRSARASATATNGGKS